MHQEITTIHTAFGVLSGTYRSDIPMDFSPLCETTGEALDLERLTAKGDDGRTEIQVTLLQLSPGKPSGYMEIESRDVASKEGRAFGRAKIRVNNRWLTDPNVQGIKDVYLPNIFKKETG